MKYKIFTLLVIFIVSIGFAVSCKKTQKIITPENKVVSDNKAVDNNKPADKPIEKKEAQKAVPRYEIIKETNLLRADKGTTYFVYILPVDLRTDAFISSIKNLVKQIVVEKKKKANISIEIFDSLNALDLSFKDKNSKEPLLQKHYIAKYAGESKDEIYKNTLYIFPNGEKDKSGAGKYFDIIDFDPAKW